jgi:ATP-binding cassette subfamily B protein
MRAVYTTKRFPLFRQHDMMDCGPTCLRMISKFYGRNFNVDRIRNLSRISKTGVSLLGISKAAESIGFQTVGGRINFGKLMASVHFPCIIHWQKKHFVIVYKVTGRNVYVADPVGSLSKYSHKEFIENWSYRETDQGHEGIVLLLKPLDAFYMQADDAIQHSSGLVFLLSYILKFKKLLFQLFLGFCVSSLIMFMSPFLTKAILDVGVTERNLQFIYYILLGQIILSVSQISIELIRSWIFLHISTRINVSIITEFLFKLTRLPLSFFDTRMTGDILQRITDHKRIEAFLTNNSLNAIFSLMTFFVFGIVLANYNMFILLIFLIGSTLYCLWTALFLKKRKRLDYKKFELLAKNQMQTIEIINGINEIKINDCATQKLWSWESTQAKLFKVSTSVLSLSQIQQIGAHFINQSKNIMISFLSAKAVIEGQLTIGEMLAIQFVIGQMNVPLDQLSSFLQTAQDAKISTERLEQIQRLDDEEPSTDSLINEVDVSQNIVIEDLTFTYPGAGNTASIKDVSFIIPAGKVTAIVGASGSGKTTLLKLLLKVYDADSGKIKLGNTSFNMISPKAWRAGCGCVMQDGYLFSDTIARNIVLNENELDTGKLIDVIKSVNLSDYVSEQPLGLNTQIGSQGKGVSGGQRQRLLIARALYKEPDYLFLDEATSALDANNEKDIVENLKVFSRGRTVVVIAHRLSTVRDADNIVVLEKGGVIEFGNHNELVGRKGYYYNLIKNQLELGN